MASPTTNWKCYVNLQDVITSTADRSSSCIEVNVFSSRNVKLYVNSDWLPTIDMNLVEGVYPYFLLIRKNQIKFVLQGRKPKEARRKKGIKYSFYSYSLFIACIHVHRIPEYWIGWSFICLIWARGPLSSSIVLRFPLFWKTCCRNIT